MTPVFMFSMALPAILAVTAPPFPSVGACAPSDGPGALQVSPSGSVEDYRDLYRSGVSFDAFLSEAVRRKELWVENWEASADVDREIVERARAVGGTWHVLAVAVDSCSDSANTIPYLARLAERVDGLEIRIVDPEAGREIMEAHPTPDGRPSTPTVLLLDDRFEKRGCFIERPTPLQTRILENAGELPGDELHAWKMEWYEEDRGEATVREFVEILEAAASGDMVCGG